MKLGILGTGNMAEAFVSGLLSGKILTPNNITGFDTNRRRLNFIRRKYRIRTAKSPIDVVLNSDVVLFSVKPQDMAPLLSGIKKNLGPRHILLSIAAGVSIKTIEKYLGPGRKIIRLMPNTPVMANMGAIGCYAGKDCTTSDVKIARRLFGAVGAVVELKNELLLDAVTGLSGSGPAYVYAFVSAMIKGGIRAGLSRQTAHTLAVQTVMGAALLLKVSGEKPENLVSKVASKGGTTSAGLALLKKKHWGKVLEECIMAATRRAKELKKYYV